MNQNDEHFLEVILAKIDENIEYYTIDAYARLVDLLAPFLIAAVTLYIIFQGYQLLLGRTTSVFALSRKTLILVFVTLLATNWDWFAILIVNTVVNTPEEIVNSVIFSETFAGPQEIKHFLLQFYEKSIEIFIHLFREAGWGNFVPLIISGIGLICSVVLVSVSFLLLTITKLSLSVLLVLAPLLIPAYLFLSTRDICLSWARLLVTTMLIPILLFALMGLFIQVLYDQLIAIQTSDTLFYSILSYVVTAILCIGLLKQVPYLAHHLGQGVTSSGHLEVQNVNKLWSHAQQVNHTMHQTNASPNVSSSHEWKSNVVSPSYLTSFRHSQLIGYGRTE